MSFLEPSSCRLPTAIEQQCSPHHGNNDSMERLRSLSPTLRDANSDADSDLPSPLRGLGGGRMAHHVRTPSCTHWSLEGYDSSSDFSPSALATWSSHHLLYAGAGEQSERFGDTDVAPHLRWPTWTFFLTVWSVCHTFGVFSRESDEHFAEWNGAFQHSVKGSMYAEERNTRSAGGSVIGHDWDRAFLCLLFLHLL